MDKVVAYVGKPLADNKGRYDLTDWHGKSIGACYLAKSWPVKSYIGAHMHQIYATIKGTRYTGRGFGQGMSVVLRPCKERTQPSLK